MNDIFWFDFLVWVCGASLLGHNFIFSCCFSAGALEYSGLIFWFGSGGTAVTLWALGVFWFDLLVWVCGALLVGQLSRLAASLGLLGILV